MYETKFMKRVLELSQQGMQTGHGGPFGCVVVKDGIIVAQFAGILASKCRAGFRSHPHANCCAGYAGVPRAGLKRVPLYPSW